MRYKLTLFFIGMTVSSFVFAADDWAVTLRDKGKDPSIVESGAQLFYTNPSSGQSSYKIDAALNITKKRRVVQELYSQNIALEFHKNTLTDKETDTKELSYSYGNQWLTERENITAYFYVPTTVAYKFDDVAETESIVVSISYYPELQLNNNKQSVLNIGKDIFIGDWQDGKNQPHPSRISWQPNIGLFYEDVVKSTKTAKGSVSRLNAGINININLLEDRIINNPKNKNRKKSVDTLVLTLSYQYWNDLNKDENTFGSDDTHYLQVYKLSYPVDRAGKIKLYASYLNGEDPVKGKKNQEYSEIGLEVKFDM